MSNPLKKTMVYLGLADEELEYETVDEPKPHVQHTPAHSNGHASVTPLLRSATTKKNAVHPEMNEILTVHPRQYKDAQIIAESFRDGIPVIINLSQMSDSDARRLVDFASGLSQGLYGKIERVTNKVFLLSPSHVVVSGEPQDSEGETANSVFSHSS